MSVSSHVNMKSVRSFEAVLLIWCLFLVCTASALLLMSYKAHAFTYENLDDMGEKALSATLSPSPSFSSTESNTTNSLKLNDSCSYLLKAQKFQNQPSLHYASHKVGSVNEERRNAEKAAALSLMLGVRIAIAPLKKRKAGQDNSITPTMWVNTGEGNPAYAVSAYRNCKKEEALRVRRNTLK